MADRALSKLEEEITCPVCLLYYSEPKVLQCLHVYCKRCLEKLFPADPLTATHPPDVTCPLCRQTSTLTADGVSGLKSAFHIQHLIEIKDILGGAVSATTIEEKGGVSILTCMEHNGQEMTLYCTTCEVPICSHCTVKAGIHCKHEFELIEDIFEREKKVVISALESVEEQLSTVEQTERELAESCERLSHQRASVQSEIHNNLQKSHELLEEKGKELIGFLNHVTEEKLANITKEKESLNISKAKLKSCESIVKNSLETSSQWRLYPGEEQANKSYGRGYTHVKINR